MENIYNMDIAMEMSVRNYENCARQSGRTTKLINSLQDGDHVLTMHKYEAELIRNAAFEKGLVDVRVTVVQKADQVASLTCGDANLVFADSVQSALYVKAVEDCSKYIRSQQRKGEARCNEERAHAERGVTNGEA